MGSPPPPTRLGKFIAIGIALALFVPLSSADVYLSRSGTIPVDATIISFVALSSVLGSILLLGLARDRGHDLCSTYRAATPVLLAFSPLTIVQLFGGFLPAAFSTSGGKFIYVYVSLYTLVMIFFSVGIAASPTVRQHFRLVLAISLVGATSSIFVDVFYPQTFSRLGTRPIGFERNPNHAAMIVVFLAIAAVDWTRSRTSDMLLWLITGLAVIATLSRSGMILLVVAFLYYSVASWRPGPQRYARNLSMLVGAVAVIVPLYSLTGLSTTTYSPESARVRLLAALLSGETAPLTTDTRVSLVADYIDLISDRPILGYGTGFFRSQVQGPHNMFLTLWVECGVMGLLAYLTALLACFWYFRAFADSRGKAFCMSLFVASFFSHNLLTVRPMIVTLGLLVGMVVSRGLAGLGPARSAATHGLARSSRLTIRRPRLTITPDWLVSPPYRRD